MPCWIFNRGGSATTRFSDCAGAVPLPLTKIGSAGLRHPNLPKCRISMTVPSDLISQPSSQPACTALSFATRSARRCPFGSPLPSFESHGSMPQGSPVSLSWLKPASRSGLSLSQNDCPSPNRHFKVKVPDLLLRCPAARLSNPFGFRFPHAFRFAPARAGSLPKTRCLTPVRQSQPFLGSPLPFRAFRTLPDQSVQSDSRP